MRTGLSIISTGMSFLLICASLRADQLEMQNGDRYSGKVLSVSADTVVLDSEVLGKISVPRQKVANLAFGTNAAAETTLRLAPAPASTNLPAVSAPADPALTNTDLSAALHNLGTNAGSIRQIREQMLAGNPAAINKFDDLAGGLLTGRLDMNDLRREAKSSADQLRELKRDLGPEAGDSLDSYLEILDNFLKETDATPTNATRRPSLISPAKP